MAMDGTNYLSAPVPRPQNSPIICFSSNRWRDAGRLRALLSGFARQREVFFLEAPTKGEGERLQIRPCALTGVQVVTPVLSADGPGERRAVLDLLLARSGPAVAWYAEPGALAFSGHVPWLATIYDCASKASPAALGFEARLLDAADLVFTRAGLHEDRREHEPHIHCFPEGIDVDGLAAARGLLPEPDDQIGLRRPLLGRYAPVDDRLDLDLLSRIAGLRPHWQFALIGAIETSKDLPRAANIHWMGERDEAKLPAHLSHWDLAIMPLKRGIADDAAEASRYLSGGRRVVSTPSWGITQRFAGLESVATVETADSFVAAAERAMLRADVSDFVAVDDLLATLSWDAIQKHMAALLATVERNSAFSAMPLSRSGSLATVFAGSP